MVNGLVTGKYDLTSHNLEHVHFKQDIDSISITIITCAQDEIHNVHCMLEGNVM